MKTEEDFWARIDVREADECWEYQGGRNNSGYGSVFWKPHSKTYTSHRLAAWLLGFVESPSRPASPRDTTHVLHQCDNPPCCNPWHWHFGTLSQNLKEAYDRGLKRPDRGAAHANAKLTPDAVRAIRTAYGPIKAPPYRRGTGISQQTLSIRYGVSQRVISLIVRGESYA